MKILYTKLTIALMLCSLTSFGQEVFTTSNRHIANRDFEAAISSLQEAKKLNFISAEDALLADYFLSICHLQIENFDSTRYYIGRLNSSEIPRITGLKLRSLGLLNEKTENYDSAEYYYNAAFAFIQPSDINYTRLLIDLGDIAYIKDDNSLALAYYKKAFQNYSKPEQSDWYMEFQIHNGIGQSSLEIFDYAEAKQELNYARNILLKEAGPLHPDLHYIHFGLAKTYALLDDYDNAEIHIDKYAQIQTSNAKPGEWAYLSAYNNIGLIFMQMRKWTIAKEWMQKAYDYLNQYYATHDLGRLTISLNLGLIYYQVKDYDQAIKYLTTSKDICQRTFNGKHPMITQATNYLAFIYTSRGNLDLAKTYLDEGLKANILGDLPSNLSVETPYIRLTELDHSLYSLAELMLLYHVQKPDTSRLLEGIEFVKLNLDLLRREQFNLSGDSRQSWNNEIHDAHYLASDLSYHLWQATGDSIHLHNIFHWFEQDKGNMLRSVISFEKEKELVNIPDSILRVEKQLVEKKEQLSSDIIGLQRTGQNTSVLWDSMYQIQQNLKAVLDVRNNYVKESYRYFNRPISSIQSEMDLQTAYLSFLKHDDILLKLSIGKDWINVQRDTVSQLEQQIQEFQKSLRQQKDYLQLSKNLYESLISKQIESLPSEYDRLVIIPDGELFHVPFEVLNMDNEMRLMDKFTISYDNYIGRIDSKPDETNQQFLAIGPSFDDQSKEITIGQSAIIRSFGKLSGAQEEIDQVNSIFNKDNSLSVGYDESWFKQNASNFQIIHLATHAVADDDRPAVSKLIMKKSAGNDGNLFAHEIDNLDINAELVTLSACNTGFGKVLSADGVLSLSYAFNLAGAQNIVRSLWPVNDESTAELMVYFYENLKSGMRKDKALNLAKQSFLENADPIKSHPYYWAGFVFSGDPRPIEIDKTSTKFFWYAVAVFLAIVFAWMVKSRS